MKQNLLTLFKSQTGKTTITHNAPKFSDYKLVGYQASWMKNLNKKA